MNHAAHNKLVAFIWSIADDCLRDVYVRGKYRDVILPMVVLRRLDALLEPSKAKVLDELAFQKNDMGLTALDDNGLKDAAGYVFYNSSKMKPELPPRFSLTAILAIIIGRNSCAACRR